MFDVSHVRQHPDELRQHGDELLPLLREGWRGPAGRRRDVLRLRLLLVLLLVLSRTSGPCIHVGGEDAEEEERGEGEGDHYEEESAACTTVVEQPAAYRTSS
uniref:Uncharacterized protein n=1 Tax=Cacopsylla melanoneura TaxID=428564 RepID=A0A8D8RUA3_9HEMI